MSDKVYVTKLPMCDIHRYELGQDDVPAHYDARTKRGQWANMCDGCYHAHSMHHSLGTGKGQELIVGEAPERDRHSEVQDAIMAGDLYALEDAIGDGDIADYF